MLIVYFPACSDETLPCQLAGSVFLLRPLRAQSGCGRSGQD